MILPINFVSGRFLCTSVDKQDYISREEFESKIESLQAQLNYWQNTTISILMKYPINGEGESSSCTVELEDKLSLKDLSQQIEEVFNHTQGKAMILYHRVGRLYK